MSEITLYCYASSLQQRIAELEAEKWKLQHAGQKEMRKRQELEAENKRLREALEKLARLGNGDRYGNSDGNCIAIAALLQERERSE